MRIMYGCSTTILYVSRRCTGRGRVAGELRARGCALQLGAVWQRDCREARSAERSCHSRRQASHHHMRHIRSSRGAQYSTVLNHVRDLL